MAISKSTFIPIEDDWMIETGIKNDDSGRIYHYLLHKHDNAIHSTYNTMHSIAGITVPDQTESKRICAGRNKEVPAHIAGLLILCRWEA